MKYVCADRGSRRCPCHLMAAGQCYTCTMIRTGQCSCEDAAGWQGVCPYTEYMQNGSKAVAAMPERLSELPVLSKIHYGGGLFVVRLGVSAGFAESCRRPGAYLMAEALGCRTPVSVLRAEAGGGRSHVELAVKAVGPKSAALTGVEPGSGCGGMGWKNAHPAPEFWRVAGPYYNGLLHSESLLDGKPVLVIARGTAAAPFLAIREELDRSGSRPEVYLDDEALPETFLEEYLTGQVYERIRLNQRADLERMRQALRERIGEAEPSGNEKTGPARVMLLVSPYFVDQLTQNMTEAQKQRLILPNPANLCCGMGFCGSCSHTDDGGTTVRLCKCSRTVLE